MVRRPQILSPSRGERPLLDSLPACQDRWPSPVVDVGWRDVVQGLMIAPVIVRCHEARQGAFELPRAEAFLELDDVLHRPVIAFELPLRHRVPLT